ncbi:MAG TPA: RIP metalloprotease RseP [Nitrospiria bacterium]|nr:RIP metalloprotease RseP [Nitrospiria bacterium]
MHIASMLSGDHLVELVKTVAIFLVVLSVLIAFHEWGHFLADRLLGVKVLTYSIGFGPKLWRRQSGETEYCLSAIPLGGYVRLFGDDPNETIEPADQARAFLHQPTLNKLAIVAAGPFFNLLLAFIFFFGLNMVGMPQHMPVLGEISPDSPAQRAGLHAGDRVETISGTPVKRWEQMTELIEQRAGQATEVAVLRDGTPLTVTVTPAAVEKPTLPFGEVRKVGQIGVRDGGVYENIRLNPLDAFTEGLGMTGHWTYLTVVSLGKMVEGVVPLKEVGGPILIAQVSAKAAEAGLPNLILFMAIISVNLAVLNFLPIPVLDGGHIFFFLIEAVIGRPLTLRTKEMAQRVGIALLLMLMILAFSNDLLRLFGS